MIEGPISKGSNGNSEKPERDSSGRFLPGWKGGPGNPRLQQMAEYRAAVRRAVSVGDIEEIMKKLVTLALDGDIPAAKEVLDRTLGKVQTVTIENDGEGILDVMRMLASAMGARS